MSKNKMIVGAAGLTAIIAVIGLAVSSYAAEGRGITGARGMMGVRFNSNLSAEDMAARQEAMAKVKADKEAMQKALTNNDYNAWKTLMDEKKAEMTKKVEEFSAKINEDTFAKLVEINKLISEKKYDEANKLRQELGFGLGFGFGPGRGLKAGWQK